MSRVYQHAETSANGNSSEDNDCKRTRKPLVMTMVTNRESGRTNRQGMHHYHNALLGSPLPPNKKGTRFPDVQL